MVKKIELMFAMVVLATLVVGCAVAQPQSEAAAQTVPTPVPEDLPRSITVVGTGRVDLVPDIARINIGVEVRANMVAQAKAQVDQQMADIMAALAEQGVAEGDIQTAQYSIFYESPSSQGPVPEGATEAPQGVYRVSNTLQVTVRDIDQAGAMLDAAIEAGANQVYGVTFTVSDDQSWESEARENAIADAQVRAQEYAELTGLTLGAVRSVSEVIGGSIPFPAERAIGGGGGGFVPGEQTLSTQVQVTYAVQ
jgi:uncharacterized protein YggE